MMCVVIGFCGSIASPLKRRGAFEIGEVDRNRWMLTTKVNQRRSGRPRRFGQAGFASVDFYRSPPIISPTFPPPEWGSAEAGSAVAARGRPIRQGERAVQDLTERRNEEAREVRNLLAEKVRMHPRWLGGLEAPAARHIYLFIQALEGAKPHGRVRRQRAPRLTLD